MARMFNTLGVALYCLLGACPVFVAGTGREMSSPYRDELTLTHRVSGVHVRIVHQLLPVPFRSGFYSFPQLANVSQTVGGPLATAKALVVLATIHPRVYGKMKGCARVYGE